MAALVVIGFVVVAIVSADDRQDDNRSAISRRSPSEIARDSVKLDVQWSKSGFGTVMIADLAFTNSGSRPVKDIEVECDLLGNSGTHIGSVRKTVFDVIPAKGRKTVREFNFGFINSQAARAACGIAKLTAS